MINELLLKANYVILSKSAYIEFCLPDIDSYFSQNVKIAINLVIAIYFNFHDKENFPLY